MNEEAGSGVPVPVIFLSFSLGQHPKQSQESELGDGKAAKDPT